MSFGHIDVDGVRYSCAGEIRLVIERAEKAEASAKQWEDQCERAAELVEIYEGKINAGAEERTRLKARVAELEAFVDSVALEYPEDIDRRKRLMSKEPTDSVGCAQPSNPLPIPKSILKQLRVKWFIDPHFGHGQIVALYSDGKCDVQSDAGPFFKGWSLQSVRGENE